VGKCKLGLMGLALSAVLVATLPGMGHAAEEPTWKASIEIVEHPGKKPRMSADNPAKGWLSKKPDGTGVRRSLGDDVAQAKRANPHVYRGKSGGVSAFAYPGEDWVTPTECRDFWDETEPDGLWYFKNHYSACNVELAYVRHEQCNPGCVEKGRSYFRLTTIARGSHTTRAIDVDVYFDKWVHTGIPNLNEKLYLNISCGTYASDGGACDSAPATGALKTITEWKATSYAHFLDPMTPGDGGGDYPEHKISHFFIERTLRVFSTGDEAPSYGVLGRCDNAPYIQESPVGGCSFPYTAGILQYDYNAAETKQSVEFFYDAMHHLDQLMPNVNGRFVPGGYYIQPLTDYYEPLSRRWNYNQSRYKVQQYCISRYGANYTTGPNGETRQCDEYPFASTAQGANYEDVWSPQTWAAKPVKAEHNSKTGSMLAEFYSFDRILDDDIFYVDIINAPND
jgi:hypothetical protein